MKILKLSLLFVWLETALAFAQSNNLKFYTFSDTIYKIQSDTSLNNRYILVYTVLKKENGKLYKNYLKMVMYDLHTQQELWSNKVYGYDKITLTPSGVVYSGYNNTLLLGLSDGKTIWNKVGLPMVYDVKNRGLLWYRNSKFGHLSSERLDYRALKTGKVKFTYNVPNLHGWDGYYYVNDTVICIKSNGIHFINIHNGESYHYKAKTGRLFSDISLSSNLLREDSCYYMADSKSIFCLNRILQPLWRYVLPKKSVSTSLLFSDSAHIFMVNYGMGVDWKIHSIGYPFIACFNKKDGKQIYLKQVAKAKIQMRDCFRKDNTEYMMFDDQLACCELSDTARIRIVPWNSQKYGKLRGVVTHDVYFANSDSTIFRKISSDYYRLLVHTDKGAICEVDKNMQVVVFHPQSECFFPQAEYKGNILLGGIGQLIRINSVGIRYEFINNISYPVKQYGNHAYVITNSFNRILDITL